MKEQFQGFAKKLGKSIKENGLAAKHGENLTQRRKDAMIRWYKIVSPIQL
jgi:hypothetical protein